MEGAKEDALSSYIEAHIEAEPEALRALRRKVNLELVYPRMCSGHLQGRVLTMLVRMTGARRVLEIGTYAGYSALCLAEGFDTADAGARIDTVEIDPEMESFIREALGSTPLGGRVRLIMGDIGEVAPKLDGAYDMVYMDANKRKYDEHYQIALGLLRAGGFLIADNTLWDGKVADTAASDQQTQGVRRFNDLVAADPRVRVVMLPVRDGLSIIQKL